jgi:hypothetical protein
VIDKIRLSQLEFYLKVYDRREQQHLPWTKIINQIGDKGDRSIIKNMKKDRASGLTGHSYAADKTIRKYRRYRDKARKIIDNIERGFVLDEPLPS